MTHFSISSLASASVIARGGYHKFFQRYGVAVFELCHYDSYSMTLSARASTFGGIVRPICFAVFKLISTRTLLAAPQASLRVLLPLESYLHSKRRDNATREGAVHRNEAATDHIHTDAMHRRETVLGRKCYNVFSTIIRNSMW